MLRVTGGEFEGAFAFAGLHQVVFPLLEDIQYLGAVHKEALATMASGAQVTADRLLLSAAVAMLF